MLNMDPAPDGFYDGLYYLTPAERLEALNDPSGFTVAERREAFAQCRTHHETAIEAWSVILPAGQERRVSERRRISWVDAIECGLVVFQVRSGLDRRVCHRESSR